MTERCQFCEQDAVTVRQIAYQDGTKTVPVCIWHDSFHGWIQTTLGNLVRERTDLKERT